MKSMNADRNVRCSILMKPHITSTDGEVLTWKALLISARLDRALVAIRKDPCEAMVTVWAAYECTIAEQTQPKRPGA